ncbi:Rv3654c family TadE-like protein [Corynebacterium wankanglinii]|uniref:Flp pilus-assembly TadE/G-like family protein n=1 Tax=Corynebacterium wankanglinii TaxID=2735136 RepID=A0A838CH22_9CORY|nr:Rv3654c family TadE-like protein [Corynebacterium wankanglinii]MBA1834237.1 flp pilus-assembly TadE/G-like family protein [Corynebacterium wankanglinii]
MRMLNDEGSATITATGIITAVVSLALAVVALGMQVADTHRVRVAADLAAVAGATAVYRGVDGCGAAQRTADLNGARVASCEFDAGDIVVSATRRRAEAAARAGP